MVIPDDYEKDRQSAADAARRFAAAVAGAVEGFVEAFEEYRVAEEAKAGIQTAGEIARAATEEGRAQAQTPEMQDLGRGLKKVGSATASAARSTTEGVRNATDSVKGSVGSAADSVRTAAHDAAESVRETVDTVKDAAQHAKEEVKVRAEAVGETGRRARVAPGRIRGELAAAYRAWMRGLTTAITMGLVMATFAIVTLVVLTIALVVGLNELVGDPAGTWIVALLYALVIGVAFFVMKSRREAAAREQAQHMRASRDEVRHVTAPVRSAFGGRGKAGF